MNVILADDSPLILRRMQEMVAMDKDIEILGSYDNGTDLLEGLKTLKPDLAIVDNSMPGLSGLEVLAEIRKVDKKVKFIILTLFSTDYHRQLAMQNGADYFFSKADDFGKLAPLLHKMVEREKKLKKYLTRD